MDETGKNSQSTHQEIPPEPPITLREALGNMAAQGGGITKLAIIMYDIAKYTGALLDTPISLEGAEKTKNELIEVWDKSEMKKWASIVDRINEERRKTCTCDGCVARREMEKRFEELALKTIGKDGQLDG